MPRGKKVKCNLFWPLAPTHNSIYCLGFTPDLPRCKRAAWISEHVPQGELSG